MTVGNILVIWYNLTYFILLTDVNQIQNEDFSHFLCVNNSKRR